MATPEFILNLRSKIGHDMLWLSGVTAVVRNAEGELLLGQRSDTGEWALIYGIIEPGEEPATAALREVKEETGIDCIPTELISVKSSTRILTYANHDQAMYMDHMFLCRLSEKPGACHTPFIGDDESLHVGWFAIENLPTPLAQSTIERLGYFTQYISMKNPRTLFSL